jgi:hypothetical protein
MVVPKTTTLSLSLPAGQQRMNNWNNPEILSFAEAGGRGTASWVSFAPPALWVVVVSNESDISILQSRMTTSALAFQTSTTPILPSSSFQHRLPAFTHSKSKSTDSHVPFSAWDDAVFQAESLTTTWATVTLQTSRSGSSSTTLYRKQL